MKMVGHMTSPLGIVSPKRVHLPLAPQRGIALVVALIFLLMLTILGVTVMQTASLEGRMAGNTQESNRIFEATQSAMDYILSDNTIFTTPAQLVYGEPAVANSQTVTFPTSSPNSDIRVDVTAVWLTRVDPGRQARLSDMNDKSTVENVMYKLEGSAKSSLSSSNATTTQGYIQLAPNTTSAGYVP